MYRGMLLLDHPLSTSWKNLYVDQFDDFFFLVLVMKRFDCLEERSASLPDRADKSIGKVLAKFSDYVSAKFDCPRIVKNGK